MHVDEFIFNCCVSSMISDDIPNESTESAMNVFSIDENKIRDANGIIFAEAITCYKCTFCGKMFAAMEVVLTHYQSNHRCSVIPLLKGMTKLSAPKPKTPKSKMQSNANQTGSRNSVKSSKILPKSAIKENSKTDLRNLKSNQPLAETTPLSNGSRLLRDSTKSVKTFYTSIDSKKKFKCHYPGCSKAFSYKNGLETHQKTHKKLKSYKCVWNDCKFKCSDLAGLEFHKKTHSGDNPYKCSWPGCDQSFADAYTRDLHIQSRHMGDMILECDYPNCAMKFTLAFERDKHKATHTGKKISAPPLAPVSQNKRKGRPPVRRKSVVVLSSSSESESSDDIDDDDDEEDDSEDQIQEIENKNEENISQQREEEEVKDENEPLDLSKTAKTANKEPTNKETRIESKTPSKRGRKRKKSSDKSVVKTSVFRCGYPGCRKTFSDTDTLKQHERDTHKTPTADERSRYQRRCKGNLYYKI